MPTDPRKRQRKLERRASKRKEKKHLQIREQNAGLAERLGAAAKFPILDCWIGDALEESGIGQVLLSRELPNGSVAVASFLVDRYCLGVKDAFGEVLGRFSYDSKYVRKLRSQMPSRPVPPADARKLLEDAVAYARNLGLPPHPDYAKAIPLFGSVNAAEGDARFEFGQNGKPFFVAGPHDTPERCRRILAILQNTCGPDGFDYLIPFADEAARFLPDNLQEGDAPLLGLHDDDDVDEEEKDGSDDA